MAQTIKLKRSSTGGAVPSTSSLSLGEVAINTYDGKMYIKKNDGTDSIVQIGAGSGSAVWNSYDYTATSSQTSFSGNDNNSESLSYVPGFLQVFLNGILLDPAVDYAATTGSSIVLTVGATTSDLVQIETFTQIIGTGDILVDTFPVSSTQTAFTLSQDPINKSNISVYVEGVYQESSTYSLSTTTLTLSESPANGTTVEVVIGTRNVTLDNIADLTISGTLHAGALDLGDANIINVNEISLDTIKGDADANTNITFAGSDVTTFTQGGQERLRLNTTGAQVTGNIVVSGTVDGRDVAADGVTADAALSRAGGAMGGAITTNSTFDGRDVSVDGTKLDGIESGATADQTDVEIRAAVESASDSNVFTNADHSKLDAIEAAADVTDATNVTAAGALMDSEVTNLAQVKAFDSSDYATAAQGTTANAALPKAGGTMTGKLTISNASYANHLELVRGSDTLYLTPSGGQLLTNGGLSPDVTNQDDLGRTDKYWQDLWLGTSLKMGGTTVIDASRNVSANTSVVSGNNSTSGILRSHYSDGSYMTLEGYGLVMNRGASYIRPSTDGDKSLYIGGVDASLDWLGIYFRSTNGLYLAGSQFIDGSRNLLNIGTISSGAITTSGNVSVGGSAYTTSADLNLLGDGLSIKNDKAGSSNNWSLIQNTDTGSASNLSFTTGLGVALTLNHNKSATFASDVGMATGHSSGKFAVMATAVHGSYDFYNNGTSYFNGSVTVDDVLNVTGTNKAIQMNGVTRINGVGDIIGTSYYVGANAVIDTSRNITAGTINSGAITSTSSMNAAGGYYVSGTEVVDASRNLTNIGTISSGAITSTGLVLNGGRAAEGVTAAGTYAELTRASGGDLGLLFNKDTSKWLIGIDNSDGNAANLRFMYGAYNASAHPGFGSDYSGLNLTYQGRVGVGTRYPGAELEVAGTALVENAKLKAIAESNTDTAVDVFVYDTRKDSDGGAWRKRTQNTSWYNETLNTSTRGARKEFPSVAVIVAESHSVTIYDGDDPDMPMWMVLLIRLLTICVEAKHAKRFCCA